MNCALIWEMGNIAEMKTPANIHSKDSFFDSMMIEIIRFTAFLYTTLKTALFVCLFARDVFTASNAYAHQIINY